MSLELIVTKRQATARSFAEFSPKMLEISRLRVCKFREMAKRAVANQSCNRRTVAATVNNRNITCSVLRQWATIVRVVKTRLFRTRAEKQPRER